MPQMMPLNWSLMITIPVMIMVMSSMINSYKINSSMKSSISLKSFKMNW